MKIELVFSNKTSDRSFGRIFFVKILKIAAETLKIKNTIELSVNLVSPAKIKSLNKKYRGRDKPTDVLSFPLEDDSLRSYGILSLGDIFICPSFIRKNTSKKDFKKEMTWLTVHGLLHLLGYDHKGSKKRAKKMYKLEQRILDSLNIS